MLLSMRDSWRILEDFESFVKFGYNSRDIVDCV